MPGFDFVDDRCVHRGVEIRFGPPNDISDAKNFAELTFECGEIPFGAFLAV
jgi:hypothetical protein